jgi:CheY-like chemotaxis protein
VARADRASTLLVIDDDADVRQFLCASLEGLGYRVIPAADGSEGLKRLGEADLLVVDFAMLCRYGRSRGGGDQPGAHAAQAVQPGGAGPGGARRPGAGLTRRKKRSRLRLQRASRCVMKVTKLA